METQPSQTTLGNEYNKGCDLWAEIEEAPNTRDASFKQLVTDAIRAFQTSAVLVKTGDFFSKNEDLADINTSSLKYLSIPFYLGNLYQKIPTSGHAERLSQMKLSKVGLAILAYLPPAIPGSVRRDLCKAEAVVRKAISREGDVGADIKRTEKIERHKHEKELNNKIQAMMKKKMEQDDEELAGDEEFERETSILFLQISAIKSFEALHLAKQELEILEHMNKLMQENNGQLPKPPEPEPAYKVQRAPFKPITLVDPRKRIAETAFRPGWNLPTVSIEEAGMIDYQIALEQQKRHQEAEKQKKLVKEFGDSDDDEVKLKETRDFDDWKDDHPRGSGNTGTKGYKY